MFSRIALFLATNLAVLFLAGIVMSLLGVHPGQMGGLLVMAALFGFGGSLVSLLMSKWMAKRSTGARVISEPRQVLWVYDQDAWAQGLDYERVPLDISMRLYQAARAANIYLARLHYERNGALEFVHSVTGVRTLKDEFDKVANHNEHHLGQIRAALKSR